MRISFYAYGILKRHFLMETFEGVSIQGGLGEYFKLFLSFQKPTFQTHTRTYTDYLS